MPDTNKCIACDHGIPKKPGKTAIRVKVGEEEKILYVSQETYEKIQGLAALGGNQKLEIKVKL